MVHRNGLGGGNKAERKQKCVLSSTTAEVIPPPPPTEPLAGASRFPPSYLFVIRGIYSMHLWAASQKAGRSFRDANCGKSVGKDTWSLNELVLLGKNWGVSKALDTQLSGASPGNGDPLLFKTLSRPLWLLNIILYLRSAPFLLAWKLMLTETFPFCFAFYILLKLVWLPFCA